MAVLCERGDLSPDIDFSFYLKNYNNPKAILDAINYDSYEELVRTGYTVDNGVSYRDFNLIKINVNGSKQAIPHYAIPKMYASVYPQIQAQNNKLTLNEKSYYSYTAKSGKGYVCTVYNGRVGEAYSEILRRLEEDLCKADNDKKELRAVRSILSELAKGYVYGIFHESANLVLPQIGIEKGYFTVNAGMGEQHYIFRENGDISDVDEKIKQLNTTNWIEVGYQPGDVFKVYGNEYVIEDDGHIHVSVENGFKDTKVIYLPKKF